MNFKTSSVVICLVNVFIGTFCSACVTYIPAAVVSGGEEQSLILTQDGVAYSCGDNGYQQLGDGTYVSNRTIPVAVNDVNYSEVITDIAAGWQHSLFLGQSKRVYACGSDSYGCLGNGDSGSSNIPAKVLTGEQNASSGYLEYIIDIAAGRSGEHSLAIDTNNMCYGWGRDEEGQLGIGYEDYYSHSLPEKVLGGQKGTTYLQDINAVSAGEQHSMALERLVSGDSNCQGRIYTFGDDSYGKLGINDANGTNRTTPMMVRGVGGVGYLTNIVAISAGWDHCMALEKWEPFDLENSSGRVYTWGKNCDDYYGSGGRLGNGTTTDACSPVMMLCGEMNTESGYIENIVGIGAGESHSMMLAASGNVYCVGDNQYGQLGNGTNTDSLTPVLVKAGMQNPDDPNAPLSDIVFISAGYWHNLAIDSSGAVWVWGEGINGKLGCGSTENTNLPVPLALHDLNVYNQTQNKWYKKIQPAINEANDFDVIIPYEGYYCENVDLGDKSIILKSTDPNMKEVVDNTRIYGSSQNVISLTSNFDSEIRGITITDGDYGIYCDYSNPIITKCIVKENQSDGIHCQNYSWPDILNTIVLDNSSTGIYSSESDLVITNCDINDNQGCAINAYGSVIEIENNIIQDNTDDGVNASSSDLTVIKCSIENNGGDGIDNSSHSSPIVQNSVIKQNKYNGINCSSMVESEIKNNWIVNNGEYGGSGIYIQSCSSSPKIFNNTIANNYQYGINRNAGIDPNIMNSIIWNNSSGSLYGSFSKVNYNCIQDYSGGGIGNITSNPQFIDADANNFHIALGSGCIDNGNPNFQTSTETDIDCESRIVNTIVDIGADEVYQTPADFDLSGNVDFADLFVYADYWLESVNSSVIADFVDDDFINFKDFSVFAQSWRWQLGYGEVGGQGVYFDDTPSDCDSLQMRQSSSVAETAVSVLSVESAIQLDAVASEDTVETVDVNAMVDWLENLWATDSNISGSIDANDWQEFLDSIESSE